MKNFSKLQAIPARLDLVVELAVIKDNGAPWVRVCVNNSVLLDGQLEQAWQAQLEVSSLHTLQVQVEMRGKSYSDQKETAVLIQSLRVSGFDLVPDHCHHARYIHDHPPREVSHYLGFNGVWTWNTQVPFYQWQHQVRGFGWLLTPARS